MASHYYRTTCIGTRSITYNTSTGAIEFETEDVIQRYSGDPLSVCLNCSKRDNCSEECMKKEYKDIKPPKNFIKSLIY